MELEIVSTVKKNNLQIHTISYALEHDGKPDLKIAILNGGTIYRKN